MRLRLAPAAACAAATALASGCGGSDSSQAAKPLPAAQWRHEANTLCTRIGREVRNVRRARHDDEVSAFVAAVAPLWKQELDATRALAAPDDIAATGAEYLGALDYLSRSLVEMHTAAERHDSSTIYNASLKVEDAAHDAKLKARLLRLPACAAQRIP